MKKPIVYIDQLAATNDKLYFQFKDAAGLIGLSDDAKSANTIFIKPNLTYPRFKEGVTTRVEFVKYLIEMLKEVNPNLNIYIGEGDGGYHSFSMTEALKNMGFLELQDKFANVKVINLSQIPSTTVNVNTINNPLLIDLPLIFFDEIDFSISCPLPKIHCMTKVTLSYKNQWGCLSNVFRLQYHYMLEHIIARISYMLKFKYAFLDGKYGLNNNGPMAGDPIEVNWFAASNSLGAFDLIVAEMMGFNWSQIRHLKIARKEGYLPNKEDIKLIGNIESLKKEFTLRRGLWAYPALVAFRSKKLTKFFYLSQYAKFLHDVMYTFRKRPIEE